MVYLSRRKTMLIGVRHNKQPL